MNRGLVGFGKEGSPLPAVLRVSSEAALSGTYANSTAIIIPELFLAFTLDRPCIAEMLVSIDNSRASGLIEFQTIYWLVDTPIYPASPHMGYNVITADGDVNSSRNTPGSAQNTWTRRRAFFLPPGPVRFQVYHAAVSTLTGWAIGNRSLAISLYPLSQ
jgi:hypothetical protein